MSRDEFLTKCHATRRALKRTIIWMVSLAAFSGVALGVAGIRFQIDPSTSQVAILAVSLLSALFLIPLFRMKKGFSCPTCKMPLYGVHGSHANAILATGCCSRCGAQIIDAS